MAFGLYPPRPFFGVQVAFLWSLVCHTSGLSVAFWLPRWRLIFCILVATTAALLWKFGCLPGGLSLALRLTYKWRFVGVLGVVQPYFGVLVATKVAFLSRSGYRARGLSLVTKQLCILRGPILKVGPWPLGIG